MSTPSSRRGRASRPIFRHSSQTGGSFIRDHQQYQTFQPQGNIDAAFETDHGTPTVALTSHDAATSQKTSTVLTPGSSLDSLPASAKVAPRIRESGIVHAMTHSNCQPLDGSAPKLVATIFYNTDKPQRPHPQPVVARGAGSEKVLQQPGLPVGAAPTDKMENYPLEPPEAEQEPLDLLYGAFVSQMCLTHFLQIIDSLQNPWRPITSSHRCLDSQIQPRVMEVTFSPPPNPEYISFEELRKHESIWRFEREWNVEVVLQEENVWRRHKRLAVFDMDSTLIQEEVIEKLAFFMKGESLMKVMHNRPPPVFVVQEMTDRVMNGQHDFEASLRIRVEMLKGLSTDVYEKVKSKLNITPGAHKLIAVLTRLGFKTAILSGGFLPVATWLGEQLGIDYVYANTLGVNEDGSELDGTVVGDVVGPERKEFLLKDIAKRHGIPLKQTMAVGDGANDLRMLNTAGLGVAVNAKPVVQLEVGISPNLQSKFPLNKTVHDEG
ncbi:MAG: hypothetical protein M1825_006032 [Sarcosagium campestre]|nr:MAG: hypothetical protein M1825_006032 [Sarcosagium campestre]